MSADRGTANEPLRKILIVDDVPMFREIETVFLGRTGNVITACDGPDALRIAQRERPDVVVTDLSMPQMGGDELCGQMRRDADLRRTPVILVTSGSAEEHERAVRAGANDVLQKPLSRATLIQSVQRVLRLRGQQRAPLETDVRLALDGAERWGQSLNVSRGGMFVEASESPEPETEMELQFAVPESEGPLLSTARVIWRRTPGPQERPGMGLQFLKLDRAAIETIDHYVYTRAEAEAAEAAG